MKLLDAQLYRHSEDVIEARAEDGSSFMFWIDDRGNPHRVTPVMHAVDGYAVETLIVNDGVHPIQLPLRVRVVKL